MSRSPPDAAELDAAIKELAKGKPHRAAAYARQYGIPAIAGERLALALLQAFSKPPSNRSMQLADAYEFFHEREKSIGYKAAHVETCRDFQIKKPQVLDNVLARTRTDVNAILRERGLLNLAD